MKSFLHRIAAGVVQPQPKLHPFVESIYSAARTHNDAEPPAQPAAFTARAASKDDPNTEPTADRIAAQSLRLYQFKGEEYTGTLPIPVPVPMRMKEPSTITERESFQPILPQSSPSVNSRVSEPAEFPAAPEGQPFHEAASHVLEYAPIVVNSLSGIEISEASELLQERSPIGPQAASAQAISAHAKQERKSSQVAARLRPAAPQSDDIQIHIGRIEVIAVQQTAPRPAAAPARKGLSLDDYLSHRNGRGR